FLMAVPFVPGAIGAFEGGIAGAFELLGRPRADGVAYALTVHATELVVVAAGFVVLAHLGVGLFHPVPGEASSREHGGHGARAWLNKREPAHGRARRRTS